MSSPSRVEFANSLRGLAALVVVVAHYSGFYSAGREVMSGLIHAPVLSLEAQPVPSYIAGMSAVPGVRLPAFGVALFFLVSGFVIPFSLARTSHLGFLGSRLLRIVPTYVAGFTVTLLALRAGTAYFGVPWPYSGREMVIHALPGLRDLLWSRHIDYVVWTLEVEVKFYALGWLLLPLFRARSPAVFLAPALLLLGSLALARPVEKWALADPWAFRAARLWLDSAPYLIFMFIGVLLHVHHHGAVSGGRAAGGGVALFLLFAVGLHLAGGHGGTRPLVVSYGCALGVFTLAYLRPRLFRANRGFDFLADLSFPLYVTHGVAGYIGLRVLADRGWSPGPSLLLVGTAAVLVAWMLHRAVERPTQHLGQRWSARNR
jgi:peptidoglycan/LPS O-acetylase OafA/YrhL